MEVQFGHNSVDEPNLLYKLQSKIKVFNTVDTLPNRGYNLVASSSKYGLVFVGVPSGSLSVYHLHQLVSKEPEPPHLSVNLLDEPTHVSVSCDYELLAITGTKVLCIYKVTDFQNPTVEPVMTIKYDLNSSSYISAMQWNPCIPDSIALAFHDGTLFACQVGTRQVKKVASKARCICWSPKGKQLVTGNSDGSLHQFKPDLTPAKAIPAPNLFEGAPVEALAVYWISTFQFAVVYKNAADNSRPSVTIVNTPKGGQPSCTNYEDICYSMGSNRPWYYFLQGLAQWNMILSASSNSMEIATIGSSDGANWLQWCQPDEARPELPLTDKKQENYPVGVCLDLCAIHQLPWGENETLPHMPLLHVVSQTGLLTIFNVINLNKQAPQLCCPPQQLNLPAEVMTSHIPGEGPKEAEVPPAPVPETKPQPVPTSVPPTSIFNAAPAAPIKVPSFTPTAATAATQPDLPEKPATVPQPKPQPTIPPETKQPQPQAPPPPPPPSQENAARKAEQERINKAKANQELKNMLVKEVNDFQNDLYNFMLKTRETQARIQRDIESINSNFNFNSLDTEELKKECSIDELRNAVVQLKLELVRACAVIAEARTHSNAREYHKWSQSDPLTAKRVASVEKMAYYVQTQLDQAQEALAYKWNKAREHEDNRSGKRMIRPILDDVYQPLVTQQEILGRQQAVLRTLRKTLNECDIGPVFKSSSLLRNTPFKNKDPLSKLTKNILNMSIEPQNAKLAKGLLTMQKLEALKDALSNRKTVKIKPINVELRQHFVYMKENYERIVREKMAEAKAMADMQENDPEKQTYIPEHSDEVPNEVNAEPKIEKTEPTKQEVPSENNFTSASKPTPTQSSGARNLFTDATQNQANAGPKVDQSEPTKQEVKHSASAPSQNIFTGSKPAPTQPSVVRNLFTGEFKDSIPHVSPFSMFSQPVGGADDSSVLKYLLQARSQAHLAASNAKTDANNLFMGQKICSPTGSAASTTTMPSTIFSKPQTETPTSKPAPTFTENQPPTSKPASESVENQQQTPKPATTFGENQQATSKPATTFGGNQQPTSKPATTFGENQQATSKPATTFGENQQATSKPATTFGENQQATSKPATTFGENQQATSKPATTFGGNQQPTSKPATTFGENQQATSKPATTFGENQQATSKPATTFGGNQQPTSKPATTFGENQQPTSKPATTFGENQSPTSKPATAFGQNQPPTFKPAATFGENQQPTFKPAATFGENQPPTSKPATGFEQNKPPTFKPAANFGENQQPTFKPAASFGENQPPTSKPSTGFGQNQPPTFKPPANFGENQQPTFKPAASFGENQQPTFKPAASFGENQPPTSKPAATTAENQPPTVKPTPTFAENKPNIHNETGEPETTESPIESKPSKPMTNLFGMKPTATSTPVPDVLKSSNIQATVKPVDRQKKENVPHSVENRDRKTDKKEVKPLGAQAVNKGFSFGLSTNNSSPSSPKPPVLGTPSTPKDPTPPKEPTPTKEPPKESQESTPPKSELDKPAETKSSATSLFGAAASQPKTDAFPQNTSIFATTNPPTVFGAKSVPSPNLTSFAQTATTQSSTVFSGGSEAKADTETVTTTVATSVFGSTPATTSAGFATTASSVFGQAAGAFAPTTSLFTSTSSTFGGFGATTQASVFETASTASSVFGTANQAFGNTTTTQASSIFGVPTTQASLIGTAAPSQSVFGATQTTQASVFGTTTQTSQPSVFGTPTQTTQASVFGTPTQTTQSSIFGTPTQTTQASLFGTPTQTTQASVFGTPTQTTQASVFGTPTQTTQASVFGTPTQTTQASVFGTPTQTTQASIFGTPTQTTQASVFGAPASQTSVFGDSSANTGGSLFGGGETNLFAAASISTTTASGTSGNIFGGSSTTSVFGGGNNVFGKTTFGQSNNTAASIFGGAAAFGQQKPANNLWAGSSSTGFGSSGFGQQTTQASSIFGGGTGSFSAPSAGAFGSPQFAAVFGTGESQSTSVFGSPQAAPGFGSSPVFGSKPAFGQPAGFGSPTSGGGFGGFGGGFNKSPSGFGAPAAFGGGSTFGGNAFGSTSPGNVFGVANAGFGASAQQSNATFENLATQNTLTFGSLAQSPQQQPQQPTFNTSPSFTGWRG